MAGGGPQAGQGPSEGSDQSDEEDGIQLKAFGPIRAGTRSSLCETAHNWWRALLKVAYRFFSIYVSI